MIWIADEIRQAVVTLASDARYDLKYTVYYDDSGQLIASADNCLEYLTQLEIDFPGVVEVVSIFQAIVENRVQPSCIANEYGGEKILPPATACGPDGRSEDWSHALAYVCKYHDWRQPAPCETSNTYKRFYFSISDEAPRCGNNCFGTPANPDIPGDVGGADWRAVREASACAIADKVLAFPVIGCCPGDDEPRPETNSLIAGGANCNLPACSPTAPCPCSCAVANCIEQLSKDMARYTTGNEFNAERLNWLTGPLQEHIEFSIIQFMCLPLGCDSIDFNNNGLVPEDQDLIDFFAVLAGGSCSNFPVCNDIDFNNDCLFPDDADLIAFLTVLAGGSCG